MNFHQENKKFTSLLDVFGLKDKEREIYSLCFFNGPLSASSIAKEIKVERTVVYQFINRLIEKGFVYKTSISDKKHLFGAVSPEELKDFLQQKKSEIAMMENELSLIRSAKNCYPENNSFSVRISNTSASLKQMLNMALNDSKIKTYLIAPVDDLFNIYESKFFYSFLTELSKKKITLYVLAFYDDGIKRKHSIWNNHKMVISKFLEKNYYPFGNGLLISDNYLFIFSWNPQSPRGLIIIDKAIRQTFLSLFFLLWEKMAYILPEEKKVFLKNMKLIPAGYFYSGEGASSKRVFVDAFLIDKTPVTNKDYKKFIKATGYAPPPHWKNSRILKRRLNHPVVNISWNDAQTYASWIGKRLPSEEEWEKSARGTDKRIYPWGNEFNDHFCNLLRKQKETTSVKKYPLGRSYYGLYDMGGNVWEWTNTALDEEQKLYIIKGGSWSNNETTVRCSYKTTEYANKKYDNIGFRCAKSII